MVTKEFTMLKGTCVAFWYYMFGDSVEFLELQIKTPTNWTALWSRKYSQGNVWKYAKVIVPDTVVGVTTAGLTTKLAFVGKGGMRNSGEIAIDDITSCNEGAFTAKPPVATYVTGPSHPRGNNRTCYGTAESTKCSDHDHHDDDKHTNVTKGYQFILGGRSRFFLTSGSGQTPNYPGYGCLPGMNDVKLNDVDMAGCQAACIDDVRCKSIDFYVGRTGHTCSLSYSDFGDVGAFGDASDCRFYEIDRASGEEHEVIPHGHYLYLNSSTFHTKPQQIAITSPDFTAVNPNCTIQFWYYMTGAGVGSLQLQARYAGSSCWYTLWSMAGVDGMGARMDDPEKYDRWRLGSASISRVWNCTTGCCNSTSNSIAGGLTDLGMTNPFFSDSRQIWSTSRVSSAANKMQARFVATTLVGARRHFGDMAIDDITLSAECRPKTIDNRLKCCSGTKTITLGSIGDSGTISDGPGYYPANAACKWLIRGPANTAITLNFTKYDVQPGFDIVSVYDGNAVDLKKLLQKNKVCKLPDVSYTTSNEMLVYFTSNEHDQRAGFEATYTVVENKCPYAFQCLNGGTCNANNGTCSCPSGFGKGKRCVPDSWTCETGKYAGGDKCDCS
jgi:hypothetical protein